MEKIVVSVIMPVLNGMPYFEKAIQSVRSQTLKNIEIIVVDAGSTDGTWELVNALAGADVRIKPIQTEKKSMGYQYNLGIDMAQGEYIGFCESDDFIEAEMMDELYLAAGQNELPEIIKSDICMFAGQDNTIIEYKQGIIPRNKTELYGRVIDLSDCIELVNTDVNMWNGIYRKDFLIATAVRLNETKGAAFQDTGFVQQAMFQANTMLYIQKAYYHYRRDNQSSSTYKEGVGLFALQEMEYMVDFIMRKENIRRQYIREMMIRLFHILSTYYGKDRHYHMPLSYEDKVEQYAEKFRKQYESLPLVEQRLLREEDRINAFLTSLDDYRAQVDREQKSRQGEVKQFCNAIWNYDKAVIFGCGENGRRTAAFLMMHHYRGEIVFCDNDIRKQGTKVAGCDVIPVETAAKAKEDALFIIFNAEYYVKMLRQLFRCNVPEKDIYCAPFILPFDMIEMQWNK